MASSSKAGDGDEYSDESTYQRSDSDRFITSSSLPVHGGGEMTSGEHNKSSGSAMGELNMTKTMKLEKEVPRKRVVSCYSTAPVQNVGHPEQEVGLDSLTVVGVGPDARLLPVVLPASIVRASEDFETRRIQYRDTRILFDSLRISPLLTIVDRETAPRYRNDKAAKMIKESGLWLDPKMRYIGSLPGVKVGDIFFRYAELLALGLHNKIQAGIDYIPAAQGLDGNPIATSVVVTDTYENKFVGDDVIVYSGQGGKDRYNKQFQDQKLEGGNLALVNSMKYGIELRVIKLVENKKGSTREKLASRAYVYDGLYKVVETANGRKSGFRVYQFKLVRESGQPPLGSAIFDLAENLKSDPWAVKATAYVYFDISFGKEKIPVQLYNDVDDSHHPDSSPFHYISESASPPLVLQQSWCSCVDICGEDCVCAGKNGGVIPYDKEEGVLLQWKPIIFECGELCKCRQTCHNRVTKHGLTKHLQVFRLPEHCWGVRSLEFIRAGTFICEFSGNILTKEQATVFGDKHLLIYPNRFVHKQQSWGDLSKIFPDLVFPTHPAIPPTEYAIDISTHGNVASYIRHSTCPNLMFQFVLRGDSSLSFPRLMIFSLENIPPMEEFTLDYGRIGGETSGEAPIDC